MTDNASNTISKAIASMAVPLLCAGIIAMVTMQVKGMVDNTALRGEISAVQVNVTNLKDMMGFNYSKSDAVADWRVQEQKNAGINDRLNMTGESIMDLRRRLEALEARAPRSKKASP